MRPMDDRSRFNAGKADTRGTPPYGVRKCDTPKYPALLVICLTEDRLQDNNPLDKEKMSICESYIYIYILFSVTGAMVACVLRNVI